MPEINPVPDQEQFPSASPASSPSPSPRTTGPNGEPNRPTSGPVGASGPVGSSGVPLPPSEAPSRPGTPAAAPSSAPAVASTDDDDPTSVADHLKLAAYHIAKAQELASG